jgi:carbon storage regulator
MDMLVLNRKCGEQIVIPGLSVTVTVISVKGNRVRLGITAPAEAVVLREELVRRKKRGGGAGSLALDPDNLR